MRSTKSETNSKRTNPNLKTHVRQSVLSLPFLLFEFVSCFGFQVSLWTPALPGQEREDARQRLSQRDDDL
jgi:hypothetical protein